MRMSDLIDRQAAIDAINKDIMGGLNYERILRELPSAEPIIRCKDCKWYDTTEEMTYGYCEAIKHSYYSRKWEINIHRTYPPDFYCADAELKDEEGDESDE